LVAQILHVFDYASSCYLQLFGYLRMIHASGF
jgi:hypothetical protein